MEVKIHHSLPGRLRLHYNLSEIASNQATLAQTLIAVQEGIKEISLNTITGSFLVYFDEKIITQQEILNLFKALTDKYLCDPTLLENVSQIPRQESIISVCVSTLLFHFARQLLPLPIRSVLLVKNIVPRIFHALRQVVSGKIFSTDLLDATALTVSVCSGQRSTASSISMLLNMGEKIEEITRRQSYNNLAQSLLTVNDDVHVIKENLDGKSEEIIVPTNAVQKGDLIVVRQNCVIPADGTVERGEGLVNQASITGEGLPVEKKAESSVFAGTLLCEGELYIRVISTGKNTKVQNIIQMIDNSQNLKAASQKRSELFAEKIVPFNFLITGLTYFFTRNVAKTISTLLVDYSCAMKLSAPIAVFSAMKEAASYGISVKGGKYLEEAALADTVVFDKTGTLTYATPVLEKVYAAKGFSADEVLKWAACLEEHFPHPLGRAVIKAAEDKGVNHPEEHAKVEYIVAHGIASSYEDKKIAIGSAHFIFDDEKVPQTEETKELIKEASKSGNSLLYLSYDGNLAGILSIGDPVRPDAKKIVNSLHDSGVKECIMITGDAEPAAKKAANETGIDKYISQALPEDKVNYIQNRKNDGHKVIMIGDGINDAPSLSCADVGIAIDGCSSIAGETADIELGRNGLENLVTVRHLGQNLVGRIRENNLQIIGLNSALLFAGIFGLIPPSLAAILHNTSTIAISLKSMQPLLVKE